MFFEQETFWTLLHDKAHWEFEIFLMVLFDGLVGALIWPFLKKHWYHHLERDKEEAVKDEKRQMEQAVPSGAVCGGQTGAEQSQEAGKES